MRMRNRPTTQTRPTLEALEPRQLLHAGSDHLAGMLDGLARASAALNSQATGNHSPLAPRIQEPAQNGQLVAPSDVHMETAPMSDPDKGDSHTASDFLIVLARSKQVVWRAFGVTGIEKVHAHLGDGVFVGPFKGRTALTPNQNYILKIRHRDSSGDAATEWSPWAVRKFRTTAASFKAGKGPVEHGWTVMRPGFTIDEAAKGLQLPVAIAFVPKAGKNPDDPFYYVAELYGNIKLVTRSGQVSTYASNLLNFNPTGDFPGSGETGLAGLVVDPDNGDLYATLLYEGSDGRHHPKLIALHSTDGGRTASSQTTLLDMKPEEQGPSHQISHISIGPDGKLYVQVGDGMVPQTAKALNQFRGKILRANRDGSAPSDNPFYNAADGITATDYIYASGFRNPFGGDWRARTKSLYEVENGPSTDRLARVVRGRDYGWNDTNASMKQFAIYNWSPASAPVNIAFVQPQTQGGSHFPRSMQDHAFVTESGPTFATGPQQRGKRVVEFVISPQGKLVRGPIPLLKYAGNGKATATALAAGPDGLYFSELYSDSSLNNPTASQARILRIRYTGPGAFVAATHIRRKA